jgi:hypothetical protein
VPVIHLDSALLGDTVDRQKPHVVWCELVLDARISEPDNQFHRSTFPIAAGSSGRAA